MQRRAWADRKLTCVSASLSPGLGFAVTACCQGSLRLQWQIKCQRRLLARYNTHAHTGAHTHTDIHTDTHKQVPAECDVNLVFSFFKNIFLESDHCSELLNIIKTRKNIVTETKLPTYSFTPQWSCSHVCVSDRVLGASGKDGRAGGSVSYH